MATIQTINAGDQITNSRADLNTNFQNLNSDKLETSVVDVDTTLAANSDAKIPSQKAVKAYVDAGGNVNASTSQRGIVEIATQAEVDAGTATGGTGAPLVMSPSTRIYPDLISFTNLAPTGNEIIIYGDEIYGVGISGTSFLIQTDNYRPQIRNTTSDWAASDSMSAGFVLIGDYIYVQVYDNAATPNEHRVYRYAKNDIATGGTLMTFSGAKTLANTDQFPYMTSDGTNFYFMYDAGNSANSYVLAKYSLSGTTLTYVSSITCGSTAITSFVVKANGNIYATRASNTLAKYNASGTEQWVTPTGAFTSSSNRLANYADSLYAVNATHIYAKFYVD